MKVREAMTGNVCLADPDRSIREVAQMMADQDIGALPIGENDRLVGMVTDRDIAVRAVAKGMSPDTKIRQVMSQEVKYCFDDEDMDDVAQNMGDIKVRRLMVLNRDKRLVGIVSIGDLAQCVLGPKPQGPLSWPDQIEIHAGKHVVRPRYEVSAKNGRSRIAHPNVERTDLANDATLATLSALTGKGHILPAPLLPRDHYTSEVLPTPMSTAQRELPVKAIMYDCEGNRVAEHRFGALPRDHRMALDVSAAAAGLHTPYGHFELIYDFDSGREVDGWLHAIFRYRNRTSGHAAETSFGAHMFNLPVTYRGEPQSYAGPPPGLTTRLFLRIAPKPWTTFCHLIYPVSNAWHAQSQTVLSLRNASGKDVARAELRIPASGSRLWRVQETFDEAALARAGTHPYVIVRDESCRLFGYHGVEGGEGAFSLDHMFGF